LSAAESPTKANVDATLEALRDMFRHQTLELIDYSKRLTLASQRIGR
jgi:hypothetical protein